jgi:hypothetical protein
MSFELEESQTDEQQSNYPSEEDTAFTPDEQQAIRDFIKNINRERDKNRSVLKGLEMSFWGITSYSLARFLILTSGTQGIALAFAVILIINQITNREAIEELINSKSEGDNMGRFIKFGFSTVVTAFLIWGALGNFFNIIRTSGDTYNELQGSVQKFNNLPDDEQNAILVVVGLLGIGGFYTIIDSRRR